MEEASMEAAITRTESTAVFRVSGALRRKMLITTFVLTIYNTWAEPRKDA
jgi:hypothetical protein